MNESSSIPALAGRTQKEIAEALGVHQPAVSRWLSGRVIPRPETLAHLAEVMGVSAESLYTYLCNKNLNRA